MRLRLIGLAVVVPVLAGCLSAGTPPASMVCDPTVVDRCVPVSEGARRSEAPPPAAEAAPKPRARVAGARFRLSTFTGKHFSVAYPAGWRVETADAWNGTYLDTTIRSARSPMTYLRVDVMPGLREADPGVHARRVEAHLRGQPGYEALAFRPTVLGRRALHWEFTASRACSCARSTSSSRTRPATAWRS